METKEIINGFETLSDKDFALSVVRQNGIFLKNLSPELRADKDVVMEAIKGNPLAILFADSSFIDDEDVMSLVREAMPEATIFKQKERNSKRS